MRILLLLLIVLMVVPSFGQRRSRDEEEPAPRYVEGISYALPRTGVRVFVTAVKEKFEPGPYAAYADQLLGITDAKNSSSVKWIIEDVNLETFAEPDPTQVYKAMGDVAFQVSLTPAGILTGINTGAETEEPAGPVTHRFIPQTNGDDGFSFANIHDSPLYIPGDSTTNFRPVRVGTETKAAEAAKRILESRRTQYDIAAGMMDEFHPDGVAYEVSLNELKKIEADYLSLFTGRKTYETHSFSFEVIPTPEETKGEVVFRFSDENGVVPASDLSGKPVMLSVEPVKELNQKYSATAVSENPAAGESGVFYRMPGVANLKLNYELNTIATMRTVLAQFGEVAPLPENLLTGEYAVKIHPKTGAIQSVIKK
ncbi:MAG: DUF4831 family protein [Prolixibacteraceae bacterium]